MARQLPLLPKNFYLPLLPPPTQSFRRYRSSHGCVGTVCAHSSLLPHLCCIYAAVVGDNLYCRFVRLLFPLPALPLTQEHPGASSTTNNLCKYTASIPNIVHYQDRQILFMAVHFSSILILIVRENILQPYFMKKLFCLKAQLFSVLKLCVCSSIFLFSI